MTLQFTAFSERLLLKIAARCQTKSMFGQCYRGHYEHVLESLYEFCIRIEKVSPSTLVQSEEKEKDSRYIQAPCTVSLYEVCNVPDLVTGILVPEICYRSDTR